MPSRLAVSGALLVLALTAGLAAAAPAGTLVEATSLPPIRETALALGGVEDHPRPTDMLDYGAFSLEVLAFVAKEIISNTRDEYQQSAIPSHLNERVSVQDSDFRRHCRSMFERMSKDLFETFRSSDRGETAPLVDVAPIAATAAAFLVLRDVASAFRPTKTETGSLFVLEPKIDVRRIGLRFGIRW